MIEKSAIWVRKGYSKGFPFIFQSFIAEMICTIVRYTYEQVNITKNFLIFVFYISRLTYPCKNFSYVLKTYIIIMTKSDEIPVQMALLVVLIHLGMPQYLRLKFSTDTTTILAIRAKLRINPITLEMFDALATYLRYLSSSKLSL